MPRAPSPEARDTRLERVAAEVRARRKTLGLTQTELAELAGTSARFVHTLENAKGTVRLDKVLDVLSVIGLELHVGVPSSKPPSTHGQPMDEQQPDRR
jgi:HTH-type transcriptional regulator / antitoxin HipB